jgi:hypothetical protein
MPTGTLFTTLPKSEIHPIYGCISDLGRSEDRIGEKKGKPKKGRGKEDESRRDEERDDGAGRREHRKADGVGDEPRATKPGSD